MSVRRQWRRRRAATFRRNFTRGAGCPAEKRLQRPCPDRSSSFCMASILVPAASVRCFENGDIRIRQPGQNLVVQVDRAQAKCHVGKLRRIDVVDKIGRRRLCWQRLGGARQGCQQRGQRGDSKQGNCARRPAGARCVVCHVRIVLPQIVANRCWRDPRNPQ